MVLAKIRIFRTDLRFSIFYDIGSEFPFFEAWTSDVSIEL